MQAPHAQPGRESHWYPSPRSAARPPLPAPARMHTDCRLAKLLVASTTYILCLLMECALRKALAQRKWPAHHGLTLEAAIFSTSVPPTCTASRARARSDGRCVSCSALKTKRGTSRSRPLCTAEVSRARDSTDVLTRVGTGEPQAEPVLDQQHVRLHRLRPQGKCSQQDPLSIFQARALPSSAQQLA